MKNFELKTLLKKFVPSKDNLLFILHEIQDMNEYNYIKEEQVKEVAKYLDLSINHIYGVITFYSMFSDKPRGKNIIRLCRSPYCHINGSENILEELKKILKIDLGQTTEDKLFTLEDCMCLGLCAAAPVMMINSDIHRCLTKNSVKKILSTYYPI